MTVAGDLPDWQGIVAPDPVIASLSDIGSSQTLVIANGNSQVRLWAIWLDIIQVSNASYTGVGQTCDGLIQQADGSSLLRITTNITTAKDRSDGRLVLPLNGFRTPMVGGLWSLTLLTGSTVANTFLHCNAGVIYSNP